MNPAVFDPTALAAVRWDRLDLEFRCTQNTHARSHPLRILDGILLTLAPPELKPENQPRHFIHRPAGPIGRRAELHRSYPVRLLFPSRRAGAIDAFIARLDHPIQNFELVRYHPPRSMTLEDLMAESPLPSLADEVCLDFFTALDVQLEGRPGSRALPGTILGHRLTDRLTRAFAVAGWTCQDAWHRFQMLPYYAVHEEFTAPSWHQGGVSGASRFGAQSLQDAPALASKLKHSADPISAHLRGRLSVSTRQHLTDWQPPNELPPALIASLIDDLDVVVTGHSLAEMVRSSEVPLRPETQRLLRTASNLADRTRLNRLLLEDAYPNEIARSRLRRIHGLAGPLYLRGPIAEVWPLLLLASEVGLGHAFPGLGAFSIRPSQPVFTPAIANAATYLAAHEELFSRHDPPDEYAHALSDPDTAATELARSVGSGSWKPSPARGFNVRKESGEGERLIAMLAPRDYVVHKALLDLLGHRFDRMFEPASIGYRPNLSPALVRHRVREACREGRVWAVRADVEQFFDQVGWDVLRERLADLLPRADLPLLELLDAVLRTPLTINGKPAPRDRGLLQGSPLSPLLSNIYLDGFDEAVQARGLCMVRFADDMLLLCRTREEAEDALAQVEDLLAPLKLRLNKEKTEILPLESGVRFLGQTYGGELDPAAVAEARARRTLYLRPPAAWAGVDHDAVVVRSQGELIARVPLRRLDGVVLLGGGGLSTRLVERLDEWDIPVVFCFRSGRPINVLSPRTREHHETAARHAAWHEALGTDGRTDVARRFVHAKLHNFLAWLGEEKDPNAARPISVLRDALQSLPLLRSPQLLQGAEGRAAAATFHYLNHRAGPEWQSQGRVPGQRHDIWNSLLDFASHLLFGRLLVITMQKGLNPWLGCLHSHKDRYESLVYDLMEPFRARLERFVLNLVRLRVIKPEDFEPHPQGGLRLAAQAVARFLEHWERELVASYSGDPGHLLDLLEAQVLCLRAEVRGVEPLRLYQARMRRRVDLTATKTTCGPHVSGPNAGCSIEPAESQTTPTKPGLGPDHDVGL
ncbi:MAG: CRISPR-associated endonuclease Cas1 [Verrucomicrobiales bacterium]|nr:CRISPR-associated endonuclease Cas1 [Verrucomicrobiales bacterium]